MLKKRISFALALMMAIAFLLPTDALDSKFSMSYIYFGDSGDFGSLVNGTGGSLSEVAPAYFSLTAQGELLLTPAVDPDFVKQMHEEGILVVPYITNDWVQTKGIAALNNMDKLTDDLAAAVAAYNLDGVNIDIENLTEAQRADYVAFVRLLREKLGPQKRIAIAVAANPWGSTKGFSGSYDYAGLAKYCDYLFLMAYDESYDGSPAGPVASLSFVERSVTYALSQVSKDKLVLGLPFYGRIWSTSGGSIQGCGVSSETVESLIANYRGNVTYDAASGTAKAVITVKSADTKPVIYGKTLPAGSYVIWYANEAALKAELALVTKYDLKGSGSWSLGQEAAATWDYYKLWLNGATFADAQGMWASDAILTAFMNGWMSGVSPTAFAPNAPLTRAQAATILVRMAGLAPTKSAATFADCTSHWARAYIDTARKYGIVSGTGADTFEPDRPVTRAEMAVMLNNLLHLPAAIESFSDVTKAQYPWVYDAICALKAAGILTGYEDGSFLPQNALTRAEAAALVTRIDPAAIEIH
ncbi:hypothetical protein SDC9_65085 [bioreactor metagenome]|uniref:Uncharacterized protein n=1 Tax=bioreactor metagenome TaxID=1076179 RepID=A0A644XR08_9ZZZZ